MAATRWTPASLTRRERLFLLSGGAALSAFLLYIFIPAGDEPAAATPGGSAVSAFHAPPAPEPVSPAPPAPVGPPPASVSGLALHGVLGGGAAVIGFPDGAQRAVPIGREFLPGLTLKAVALHHVLIGTASGEVRLAFNKPADEAEPAAAAAASGQSGDGPEAERRERETLEFRTGLLPLKENGRTTGFAIRPGARLALFERSGLRAGDVIVAVNGQAFRSEEKLLDLSDELARSSTAEIVYLRGGRRLTGTVRMEDKPEG